ncbi:MAG: glucuronate isomerase, partial [Clostridia bacterium]
DATLDQANAIFKKALSGVKLTDKEVEQYKGYVLIFLGKQYNAHKWTQQYHIGAMRNNSARYMRTLGADTGFDAIMDTPFSKKLAQILNRLDETDELPKTILYSLNPSANEVLSALKNCFQSSGTIAKIQFGSAWWFNDQQSGIDRQLTALNEMGLISKFVGMLTDSRSFMSYPRHEFFRRLLCDRFGQLIERGEYPRDIEFVGKVIEDICYNNAKNYFAK